MAVAVAQTGICKPLLGFHRSYQSRQAVNCGDGVASILRTTPCQKSANRTVSRSSSTVWQSNSCIRVNWANACEQREHTARCESASCWTGASNSVSCKRGISRSVCGHVAINHENYRLILVPGQCATPKLVTSVHRIRPIRDISYSRYSSPRNWDCKRFRA